MVIVAQLVRALDCGSRGRGFEPRLSPKMKPSILLLFLVSLFACNTSTKESSSQSDTLVEEVEPVDPFDTTGGKGVFFVDLVDSQEVSSPLLVKMSAKGKDVVKAGPVHAFSGHHHIIVDGTPTPVGETVMRDDTHFHYGEGQMEGEIKLTPGYHTLTLQFANGIHTSFGPAWSRTITVKVK
jgi:hypothetical protein